MSTTIEDVDSRAFMADKPVPYHLKDRTQMWVVMSIVAPNGCNQKAEELCIRVYGCRSTVKEANELAKEIQKDCNFFDVFTAPCYEWLPLPPKLEDVEEHNFTDTRVQNIHDSYIEHLRGQKADMIQRMEEVAKQKEANKLMALEEGGHEEEEEEDCGVEESKSEQPVVDASAQPKL